MNATPNMSASPHATPLSFGVYRKQESPAHRLDPRAKIIFCLLFLLAAVLANSVISLAALTVLTVLLLVASRTTPRLAWRTIRPMMPLVVFVVLFDALFVGEEAVVFALGPLSVTGDGLAFAATSAVKFLCALLGASTLMTTTSPTALSDGFALLAAPLQRIGLPVDRAAFALNTTFRFVPVFIEEFYRIRAAQADRHASSGSAPHKDGLFARIQSFIPVLIPLFAGAFRRADTLAAAVRNRGFGTAEKRSCLRAYHLQAIDWCVIALGIAFLILAAMC